MHKGCVSYKTFKHPVANGLVINYTVFHPVPTEAPRNLTLLDLKDATTALLAWEPVSNDSLRGHFKGYKVRVSIFVLLNSCNTVGNIFHRVVLIVLLLLNISKDMKGCYRTYSLRKL